LTSLTRTDLSILKQNRRHSFPSGASDIKLSSSSSDIGATALSLCRPGYNIEMYYAAASLDGAAHASTNRTRISQLSRPGSRRRALRKKSIFQQEDKIKFYKHMAYVSPQSDPSLPSVPKRSPSPSPLPMLSPKRRETEIERVPRSFQEDKTPIPPRRWAETSMMNGSANQKQSSEEDDLAYDSDIEFFTSSPHHASCSSQVPSCPMSQGQQTRRNQQVAQQDSTTTLEDKIFSCLLDSVETTITDAVEELDLAAEGEDDDDNFYDSLLTSPPSWTRWDSAPPPNILPMGCSRNDLVAARRTPRWDDPMPGGSSLLNNEALVPLPKEGKISSPWTLSRRLLPPDLLVPMKPIFEFPFSSSNSGTSSEDASDENELLIR
jgi:hypothetical protein